MTSNKKEKILIILGHGKTERKIFNIIESKLISFDLKIFFRFIYVPLKESEINLQFINFNCSLKNAIKEINSKKNYELFPGPSSIHEEYEVFWLVIIDINEKDQIQGKNKQIQDKMINDGFVDELNIFSKDFFPPEINHLIKKENIFFILNEKSIEKGLELRSKLDDCKKQDKKVVLENFFKSLKRTSNFEEMFCLFETSNKQNSNFSEVLLKLKNLNK